MKTVTPRKVARAQRRIAEDLEYMRRLQRLPMSVLTDRCGLSQPTVSRMLNQGTGSLETFLRVCMALGMLDGMVEACDPLNTSTGRALAFENVPQRVRSTSRRPSAP